jgi:hypothetical protein
MEENINKNQHGAKGIKSLDGMVESLKAMDYIVDAKKNYSIADPDYKKKQFKFQYLIEFQDNEQWILQHTTSIRDRINCQQWHSEHIKRLNEYVKKAYVVVPDSLSEKEEHTAKAYNDSIVDKKIYSALDGVLPFATMYSLIEKKAADLLSGGQAHAKLGLHFEKKLVDALNNDQNFDKWKSGSETAVGYLYSLYMDVLTKLQIKKEDVISFNATSDIPKLPSGGSPKTDVLLEVQTLNGIKDFTFSCKRSDSAWVSVHEYTAETFSTVLNPEDAELKALLLEFQNAGGIKALGDEGNEALSGRMKFYADKLAKWVIGGIGGEGNEKTQWAEYIITLDENSNTYSIHTIDEYIDECKSQGVEGQFGTLFRWTYPSGGKGKRIQLKGKML